MPYMPTNFYPKNCAIDLVDREITFAADIDIYDTIREIEIEVFDYYDKESLFAVRIQQNNTIFGDERDKYKTKVTTWDRGKVEVKKDEEVLSGYTYTNYYALYTNRILLPLSNGERFKFSLPLNWNTTSLDKLYEKDAKTPEEVKTKETNVEIIKKIHANRKYYWKMTVIDSSGESINVSNYSVWATDGFVHDIGIIGLPNDNTAGVVYVAPSKDIGRPIIYDKNNDTYYRNQIFVHEKLNKGYGFSVRPGTAYYDQESTAHKLGLRTGYKDEDTTRNDEYLDKDEKLAIFSEVISLQDSLDDDIVYEVDQVRNRDTLQFTIDIYNFNIKKIYKKCYYHLNEDGSIGALVDTANLTPGYTIKNNKWYMDGAETETYKYKYQTKSDGEDSINIETKDLHGPFTIIEYEDEGNLIPLVNGNGEPKKDLSGHYLHLSRLWTSLYLYENLYDENKIRLSEIPDTILIDDYYKIMSNHITSFDNYFETVENLKALIIDINSSEENSTNLTNITTLNGPARTFKGKFNGDLEWSYWETKLVTYTDTDKKIVLGEEILDISEKNYTKQITYTYFGFQEIKEYQEYEITLYVKDKRNLIVSSTPCKIEKIEIIDLSKEENGVAVKAKWNYEKSGIEVDFSQLIGVNGQLYRGSQEVDVTNDNFKFKDGTRLAYIQHADYLLYDVLKNNKNYFHGQEGIVFACQGLEPDFSNKIIKIGGYEISFIANCNNDVLSPAFKINDYILPLYGSLPEGSPITRASSATQNEDVASIFSNEKDVNYNQNYIFDGNLNDEDISDSSYLVYGDMFFDEMIYCYFDKENFIIQFGDHYWSFTLNDVNIKEFGNIYLYPALGYKYLYFNTPNMIKDNLLQIIGEGKPEMRFKDTIESYTPSWYSFTDATNTGIKNSLSVFFTDFGKNKYPNLLVTNGIKLQDNDSNGYIYEGIVIYRECYDSFDNLINTIFINIKSSILKSVLYDYSVSNKYKYYYRIIPYYTHEEDIRAWSFSGSNQKVQPDYYDVSLFEACNDFNFDKIYNYNPAVKSDGRWDFMLDVIADDITYTSETAVTPGNKFAKIAKNNMLYMQGSVSAKVGTIKNEVDYIKDDPIQIKKLVNSLNRSGVKMIRLKNGECILVDTQVKSRKNQSNLVGNPTDISFDWYQIEDQDFFFYEFDS